MATVPNGANIAQIASVFGLASNAPISAIAAAVGVAANSPISTYYGRSPTPAPTPAPSFDTNPTLTPATGTAGVTQYAISDPAVSNGTISSRQFLLNGAVIGGGNTITVSASSTGILSWRAVADGPGGSRTFISNDVQVVAPPSAASFTPDGGYQSSEKQFITELSLLCSQNATWTYTVVSGSGGVANIPTGTVATGILFRVTAAGAAGQRVSRSQKWNVRGQAADGTIRDFTVELTALGDNA